MKTDDGGNAARLETLVQHAPQRGFELFQFVIDGDAQRLKDLGRGVPAAGKSPASILRPADRLGQIEPRSNRA